VELQHYLTILRDRWISALVAAVVVLGAVVGFTFLQTPEYQATNRVFVQTQAGSSVADLSSGVNFASQQITSYADVATTPLVLDPVIEQLGLDMTAQELALQISTTVPPETLILEITATSEDPAEAAAIANATSESLRAQVTELETAGEEASVELTVISPATEPESPASPRMPLNLAIGVVLALLAGVAVAILRDILDNSVRRPEDIERTFEKPVIAAIPASKDAKHLPLITAQHPQSLQAEAYRSLRTNLQFMGLTGENRSVLVTSSLPGEGKSSSAINLARVIAQAGNHVLLIDADLRRPSVAEYLGLEGDAGLTSVLIGDADIEDVAQPMETEGLDVLASGPIPPNPSELLGSKAMQELLAHAMATYDFVVVDTAPLLAVTDAVVLSRYVGGTVVVAQSERVRRPQLQQSLEKLDAVEARMLGVVLNRVHGSSRGTYTYNYSYTSDEAPSTPRAVAKAAADVEPGPIDDDVPTVAATAQKKPLPSRHEQGAGKRRGRRVAAPLDDSATPKPWPGAAEDHQRAGQR
jgi:capsular exopolysaccharide synthesis family protein